MTTHLLSYFLQEEFFGGVNAESLLAHQSLWPFFMEVLHRLSPEPGKPGEPLDCVVTHHSNSCEVSEEEFTLCNTECILRSVMTVESQGCESDVLNKAEVGGSVEKEEINDAQIAVRDAMVQTEPERFALEAEQAVSLDDSLTSNKLYHTAVEQTTATRSMIESSKEPRQKITSGPNQIVTYADVYSPPSSLETETRLPRSDGTLTGVESQTEFDKELTDNMDVSTKGKDSATNATVNNTVTPTGTQPFELPFNVIDETLPFTVEPSIEGSQPFSVHSSDESFHLALEGSPNSRTGNEQETTVDVAAELQVVSGSTTRSQVGEVAIGTTNLQKRPVTQYSLAAVTRMQENTSTDSKTSEESEPDCLKSETALKKQKLRRSPRLSYQSNKAEIFGKFSKHKKGGKKSRKKAK